MARYKDLSTLDATAAKQYMRVTHAHEDVVVGIVLNAALSRVDSILDADYVDVSAVPAEADLATLRLCEAWFKTRRDSSNESGGGFSAGFGAVPNDVRAMLVPHRNNVLI